MVGHSYIVYGPLIAGMATIMYEGLPIRPDAGIWWSLVEKYKVTAMFSAPTAVRVLKKQDPKYLRAARPVEPARAVPGRRAARRAHRDVDRRGARQADHRQLLADRDRLADPRRIANGVEQAPSKFGSPGVPMYGYDVKLLDEATGARIAEPDQKGVVAIEGPLPPGCMQTVWRDDARFVETYWSSIPGRSVYSTFDWGIRDDDGYFFILGRTDDVINVAGHRLGTREIEESISSHPNVAEVAVVGVADALKGQVAMAFVDAKDASALGDADAPAQARRRDHEDGRRAARRRRAAGAGALRRRACRRRAPASCCAARSRRSASGATRAT